MDVEPAFVPALLQEDGDFAMAAAQVAVVRMGDGLEPDDFGLKQSDNQPLSKAERLNKDFS